MCLLFVYINKNPGEDGYRLILASNRDEFWQRPTDLVDFRDSNQWVGGNALINVLPQEGQGADLVPGREGGSWLGISTNGKVAILLNILSSKTLNAKGRGSLVRDFLTQDTSAEEYVYRVSASASQYNPFHLLTFDLRDDCNIHYVTYCDKTQMKRFPPGYFGADNGSDIEKPWKKREEGEARFARIIEDYGTVGKKDQLICRIIDLLNDKTQFFFDEQLKGLLKDVGRPDDMESFVSRSSIFLFNPQGNYGTRTNTVILVDKGGNCEYVERTLQTPVDTKNLHWVTKKLQFKLTL